MKHLISENSRVHLTLASLCAVLAFCLFLGNASLSAQNKGNASYQVTGTVRTEGGESVIGAGVVVKGTLNGTTTDIDGKFSLKVPSESTILQISFMGYVTEDVPLNGRNNIVVTMKEDKNLLEEVVVIGYGTVKKKDLTGSIANVEGKHLADMQSTSLAQALQGSMPGVQVTRSSGLPGASATIRVRGVTTIGDSDPLVIVDGVQVGSMNDVDVDAVENITVLKDAASASIYGARASSGVILITTKRAKPGTLSLDYKGTYGIITRTTHPKMASVTRYMEMLDEIAWNDGGNIAGNDYSIYTKDYIDNYIANNAVNPNEYPITDWDKLLVKKSAPRQKHNVSVTYGNNVVKTKAMLGYEKEDALYYGRSVEDFTSRINNDIKINKYLSASIDMSFEHTYNPNTNVNPLQAAYKYGPNTAAMWADGRIAEGHNGSNTYARLHYGGFSNNTRDYFYGKVSVIFNPFKNFTITGNYAPSIRNSRTKTFSKQVPYYSPDDPTLLMGYITDCTTTSLTEARGEYKTTTKQLLADYKLNINNSHNFTFMAGYEDYHYFFESLSAAGDHFELSDYPYLDRAPLDYISVNGNATENAYVSYFGRATYDFKGKYLLQVNARYDGSSRFYKDNRWGFFPSASFGWVATEEPFVKNLNLDKLNFLKFRASYGTLGNEKIGNYPYQAIMNLNQVLLHNGTTIVSTTTAAQAAYNIKNITWETTKTWNVGLDASMFNSRLSFSGDLFRKDTYDMLLALEIPDLIGYSNPSQNAGKMHTNGWEIQLGWQDRKGPFSYSVSANVSDYKSVMGDLSGIVFDGNQIIRKGSQYNEWYGYVSDGLFQSDEDIANSALLNSNVRPGDVKYKDISGPEGKPDGKITADYDRVLLGGSTPRYQYGGNINFSYKNLGLSMTFQGIGKQKVLMSDDMVYQTVAWYNFPEFYDKSHWSAYNTAEQNANAKYPRLSQLQFVSNNYKMSDFWLFNGAYFRMKNITLNYSIPTKVTEKVDINKVNVFASVTDPFSIDHFPQGWDPENSISAYIARTWNFGVSITF
jgi:TonB-linked SusC/RagA family outer membrane protein